MYISVYMLGQCVLTGEHMAHVGCVMDTTGGHVLGCGSAGVSLHTLCVLARL